MATSEPTGDGQEEVQPEELTPEQEEALVLWVDVMTRCIEDEREENDGQA
jgi:hypothetical protein